MDSCLTAHIISLTACQSNAPCSLLPNTNMLFASTNLIHTVYGFIILHLTAAGANPIPLYFDNIISFSMQFNLASNAVLRIYAIVSAIFSGNSVIPGRSQCNICLAGIPSFRNDTISLSAKFNYIITSRGQFYFCTGIQRMNTASF